MKKYQCAFCAKILPEGNLFGHLRRTHGFVDIDVVRDAVCPACRKPVVYSGSSVMRDHYEHIENCRKWQTLAAIQVLTGGIDVTRFVSHFEKESL